MKNDIDNFLANLGSKAVAGLNSIMIFTAGLTLSDWLDISQKWVTFVITVVVGFLSARHYLLKNKKLQREIELKDQEIYRVIAENKHRSNGRK